MFAVCVLNEKGITVIPKDWIFNDSKSRRKCRYPADYKFTPNEAQFVIMNKLNLPNDDFEIHKVYDVLRIFGMFFSTHICISLNLIFRNI